MTLIERVKEIIIKQLGVTAKEITMDASFINDLGADSLDIVTLILTLEEEFNIQITDREVEKLDTVGKAINYIKNRLINRRGE